MLSHNGSNTNYELMSNWMNLAINKLWGNYLVSVWMLLKWNELRVCVLICGSCALFMGSAITFFSKNNFKSRSHDTIHIFKNYFVTVFSIFNFQFSTISSIQTYYCQHEHLTKLYEPRRNFEGIKLKKKIISVSASFASGELCVILENESSIYTSRSLAIIYGCSFHTTFLSSSFDATCPYFRFFFFFWKVLILGWIWYMLPFFLTTKFAFPHIYVMLVVVKMHIRILTLVTYVVRSKFNNFPYRERMNLIPILKTKKVRTLCVMERSVLVTQS